MKRAAIAIAGLVCSTAAVAHAQGQTAPSPAPATAAPAAATPSCSLVTKNGEQYVETPLAGFDPAVTSRPLPPAPPAGSGAMVLCKRATMIPEVTDYRVLAEMHVPLAINAGPKSIYLGAAEGRLQIGMPDGQTVTPAETKALQDRLDQMQSALQAKAPAKPPAK